MAKAMCTNILQHVKLFISFAEFIHFPDKDLSLIQSNLQHECNTSVTRV